MPSKQSPSDDNNSRNLAEIFNELTNGLILSTQSTVFQSFQKLTNFFQQQEQTIKYLQSENRSLIDANAMLKEKLDNLDKRLTDAMSAIANHARNEGGKPKLESVELIEKFQ